MGTLKKKVLTAWHDIKRRCYNPKYSEFKRYGAVGITLQDSWLKDSASFYNYVSKLPNFTQDMSIDRINNKLGYKEGNLRWATKSQQCQNQGKSENNTTGFTGVTWYYNVTGGTRAIAWCEDKGKTKSKSFSVKRFGLLPAFNMACNCRVSMILMLNEQGENYSDDHGN